MCRVYEATSCSAQRPSLPRRPAPSLLFTIRSRSKSYEGSIILPHCCFFRSLEFLQLRNFSEVRLNCCAVQLLTVGTYFVFERFPFQMSVRRLGYADRSNSGIILCIQILPTECTYGFLLILIISYINAFLFVSETKCVLCVILAAF